MEAKGTFYVGRKQYIVAQFGEPAWTSFVAHMATLDPLFEVPVLATDLVPIPIYLRFQEEMIKRFFQGNDQAYWKIGEQAGEWALTDGPYKHFRQNPREFKAFVEKSLPRVWSNYFTRGELRTSVEGLVAEGELSGLPVWHVTFEYSTMGFMRRAIELAGFSIKSQHRLKGISAGDKLIHYRYELKAAK
jgi:hypothetical protein